MTTILIIIIIITTTATTTPDSLGDVDRRVRNRVVPVRNIVVVIFIFVDIFNCLYFLFDIIVVIIMLLCY